jgi:hypothetical protein
MGVVHALTETRDRAARRVMIDGAAVLAVARRVDADRVRLLAWFDEQPIAELGMRTAREVVADGDTAQLIHMLWSIERGNRD